MLFLPFLFLGAAFASETTGGGPRPKTAKERREQAIREYGETRSPYAVGFILADGRWVDFAEGTGGVRTLDHRNIAWLLEEGEEAPDSEQGSATTSMNRWMDLAQAIRVSRSPSRTPGEDYALVDLPMDPVAVRAVLADLRPIARFLVGVQTATLGYPDQTTRHFDHVLDLLRELRRLSGKS